MTTQYQRIRSCAGITELKNQLPKQIRQAVTAVIEADPTSDYFYKLSQADYQIQFYLIEQNECEAYTICHCFSTDIHDPDYAYESMSLSNIQTFSKMARELTLT
ncbi:hypothetical protein [uncultured Brevibacillus sp.]|uniref:hypothetical protein n=1 Tax=uncultured Brevibacillus sp. TaxID=169970 RepID=UPI0025990704|nr:hypothetical protein [uncultured Brevibacillus sp.]